MVMDYGDEGNILELIKEGMDVYDAGGNEIGEVDDVFFGTMKSETTGDVSARAVGEPLEEDTLVGAFMGAFDEDDLPEALRARLLSHGFLHLKGGLFGDDSYVLREQIARVTEDGVYLKAHEEEKLIED